MGEDSITKNLKSAEVLAHEALPLVPVNGLQGMIIVRGSVNGRRVFIQAAPDLVPVMSSPCCDTAYLTGRSRTILSCLFALWPRTLA